MNGNNRNNMFLAIALSALVIFGWQYFVVAPQMKAEQARQAALAHQEKGQPQAAARRRARRKCAGHGGRHRAYVARSGAEGGRRARGDRQSVARRLDRAQGRQARRSAPQEISRDHRSQEPGDRAAGAQEHRLSLLRGIRLDRRSPMCPTDQTRVDAARQRRAVARPSGDADLGQWPGPHLHPRHLGR